MSHFKRYVPKDWSGGFWGFGSCRRSRGPAWNLGFSGLARSVGGLVFGLILALAGASCGQSEVAPVDERKFVEVIGLRLNDWRWIGQVEDGEISKGKWIDRGYLDKNVSGWGLHEGILMVPGCCAEFDGFDGSGFTVRTYSLNDDSAGELGYRGWGGVRFARNGALLHLGNFEEGLPEIHVVDPDGLKVIQRIGLDAPRSDLAMEVNASGNRLLARGLSGWARSFRFDGKTWIQTASVESRESPFRAKWVSAGERYLVTFQADGVDTEWRVVDFESLAVVHSGSTKGVWHAVEVDTEDRFALIAASFAGDRFMSRISLSEGSVSDAGVQSWYTLLVPTTWGARGFGSSLTWVEGVPALMWADFSEEGKFLKRGATALPGAEIGNEELWSIGRVRTGENPWGGKSDRLK